MLWDALRWYGRKYPPQRDLYDDADWRLIHPPHRDSCDHQDHAQEILTDQIGEHPKHLLVARKQKVVERKA